MATTHRTRSTSPADSRQERPPIVVLGGTVSALSVTRSMARAGVAVYALTDGRAQPLVRHSRYPSAVLDVPDADVAERAWLSWLASGPKGAVILPCSDFGVEFVALHRGELSRLGYRPTEADDDISLAMLDKSLTYELAEKIGVEVPRTLTLRSAEDLERGIATFSFPCALKPLQAHRSVHRLGCKAYVASDAISFRRAYSRVAAMGIDAMMTEIIPGPESAYCSAYGYLDAGGSVLAQFTKRKSRQYPRGFGYGCFHETAWEPEAAEIGLRFLREAGYVGLAVVEFKRDARDGRLKLIECNPRLSATTELIRIAGVDLARLAYERALGWDGPRFSSFRSGLREWYPLNDARAYLAMRKEGQMALTEWLSTLKPPMHLPIFDRRDVGPSLAYGFRRVRRRALGALGSTRETGSKSATQSLASLPRS